MVQKRQLRLDVKEREVLEDYRDHDPRAQVRERCAALLKIGEGQSAHEVARHGLLKARDPDSVYSWLNAYERNGVAGLLNHLHGGSRHCLRRGGGGSERTFES